jgi:uncharacterized protein
MSLQKQFKHKNNPSIKKSIKLEKVRLNNFRFKKYPDNSFLITNDFGDFSFLTKDEFSNLSNGLINKKSPKYFELEKKDFFGTGRPTLQMIQRYRTKNKFVLSGGPSLHIIILTQRCNHKCVYCQASAIGVDAKNHDLDIVTAKKIVDFIFQSTNNNIAIELQGGEPTLNWPTLEFIVKYAKEKNKTEKRNLELRLVTNFSVMTEDRLNFLFENLINISTSLDGQMEVHNKNRIFLGKNKTGSYETVSRWLKKSINRFNKEKANPESEYKWQPGAITTISKFSLKFPREIVNEYQKWGFENVFLRPVNSLGVAKNIWSKVGYSADDYLEFYKKALNYIIDLNKKGIVFRELLATNMLVKILTSGDPNYSELRSPCGAAIGQLLYNYDGNIFTCDEGRMVGEDEFLIGNVDDISYQNVIESPKVKSVCVASCMENLPCDHCAYKIYCGVCPVHSYVNFGNIFTPTAKSDRCKIYMSILDFLFEKIKDEKVRDIFEQWVIKQDDPNTRTELKCY